MIDPKWLRTDPDRIRRSQAARGASVELVDELIGADEARRAAILAFETLRAEQKGLGKQVAQAKGDERQTLLERTKRSPPTSSPQKPPSATRSRSLTT